MKVYIYICMNGMYVKSSDNTTSILMFVLGNLVEKGGRTRQERMVRAQMGVVITERMRLKGQHLGRLADEEHGDLCREDSHNKVDLPVLG